MREAGISPVKALGQHFLTDANVLNRIVEAAELTAEDTVVEIGPGLGALTQRLVRACGRVIAIELDEKLAARLKEQMDVTVVPGDALRVAPEELLEAASLAPHSPYVLVGNLPYNAGTAIVRHFLGAEHPPQRLIVMLQREVAESMTAPVGEMGLLAVSVQVYAEAQRLFNVPPRAFYPPPKVTSTVLHLDVRSQPLVPRDEMERFFRVVRAGFSAPRKQLRNTLANGLSIAPQAAAGAIEAAGLDGSVRPALLSIDDWVRLSRVAGD